MGNKKAKWVNKIFLDINGVLITIQRCLFSHFYSLVMQICEGRAGGNYPMLLEMYSL